MPRNYIRLQGSAGYRKYDERQIEAALDDILNSAMSIRASAEKHSIPYTTLQEHSKGFTKVYGGQPALCAQDEAELAESVAVCGEWGFPLRRDDIQDVVQQFLERKDTRIKKFVNNRPGMDWILSFLRRHKDLIFLDPE